MPNEFDFMLPDMKKYAAKLEEEHAWLERPVTHLYHGTSATLVEDILRDGIKPRRLTKKNNWKRTISSRDSSVYMTIVYPLHFAAAATSDGQDMAIFEIEKSALLPHKFHADEDAIEQSHRNTDELPKNWDIKRRTIYYRSRAHLYSGEGSLKALGTAAYNGIISPFMLTRLVIIPNDSLADLLMMGNDPEISLSNYQFLGGKYRALVAWLFGDREVDQEVRERLKITVRDLRK